MNSPEIGETELCALLTEVASTAKRSFGRMTCELGEPSDLGKLRELSDRLGGFSKSHFSFLEMHDGLQIKLFSNPLPSKDNPFPVEARLLDIFNLDSIDWMTRDFRRFFEMVYEPSLPYYSPDSAARFVNIAAVMDGDNRIVSCIDRPTADGEFLIKDVRIDMNDWLLDDNDTTTQWIISTSFSEFLRKCLSHFARTADGFAYWNPTITG